MVALSSVWNLKSITNTDMKRAQRTEFIEVSNIYLSFFQCCSQGNLQVLYQNLRRTLTNFNTSISNFPILVRGWSNVLYVSVVQPYADASEGKRLCWKICALNAGVWVAWKIKSLKPFMVRSFMHHPLSGLSYTLLTSMFRYEIFLDRSNYLMSLNCVCVGFTAI
jgi:rhomboid-like protein